MSAFSSSINQSVLDIVRLFEQKTRFRGVNYEIKERADGPYLILNILEPKEYLYAIVSEICGSLPEDNEFRDRVTIKKRKHPPIDRLSLPETALLKTVLTESLTASSSMNGSDFLGRYIRSVSGAEEQIAAKNNHIVLGRRGSGKSCLLLYTLNSLRDIDIPCVWIAMQTYEGRSDFEVVTDVFVEILRQLLATDSNETDIQSLMNLLIGLDNVTNLEQQFDRLVPKIRRSLAPIVQRNGRIVLFLDDIHVIDPSLQPILLAKIYSIARDNGVYLKISGIEQLTNNWDPEKRKGLEIPGDAQIVPLDYNLTMPDKSLDHIKNILNAQAGYCGLPNIEYICGDNVIPRLVWVAAGVPRDALSVFLSAISRAALKGQRRVSITSINEAASLTADLKLGDIARDVAGRTDQIKTAFGVVRDFCIRKQKVNAFLVEIASNSSGAELLKELIALRLLHVLHEGVTPNEAGRRYMALMLDFGFYVGIRASRSVGLFQKEPAPISAKDLRRLPIFPINSIDS